MRLWRLTHTAKTQENLKISKTDNWQGIDRFLIEVDRSDAGWFPCGIPLKN